MNPGSRDVAQIRFAKALLLFDEFVQSTVKLPDAATLRGLEGRFIERLQIQPSYWSQIKSRSRQIGEPLARQFEQSSSRATSRWAGWTSRTRPGTTHMAQRRTRSVERRQRGSRSHRTTSIECLEMTMSTSSCAWCSAATGTTRNARVNGC